MRLCGEELFYNNQYGENRLLDLASLLCPSSIESTEEARQALWAFGMFADIVGKAKIVENTDVHGGGGIAFIERRP